MKRSSVAILLLLWAPAGTVSGPESPPRGSDPALQAEIRVLAGRLHDLRETVPALDPEPLAVRASPDLIEIAAEIRAGRLLPKQRLAARGRAWADLGLPETGFPAGALRRVARDIAGVGLDLDRNRLLVDTGRLTDDDFFSERADDSALTLLQSTGVRPDEPVMAHALMHLLQHQRGTGAQGESTDAILAAAAMAEGEANLAAVMVLFRTMGLERSVLALGYTPDQALDGALMPRRPDKATDVERRTLDFIYLEGFEALSTVWQAGGWRGVDRFIGRSGATHDLIHTDRPPAGTPPPEVRLPELPREYQVADRDSVGEFGVILLVSLLTGKDDLGMQAGDGWVADRLVRLEREESVVRTGSGVTIWVSRWRSEAEAEEFLGLYRRGLAESGPREGREARAVRNGATVEVLVRPAAGPPLQPEDP